jgi:hypothetical protein
LPTSFYIFILAGSQLLYRIAIINTLFISFSLFPKKQTNSDNFPVFPTPQTAMAEFFNPKPTHPQDPRFTSPLIPTSLSLSLSHFFPLPKHLFLLKQPRSHRRQLRRNTNLSPAQTLGLQARPLFVASQYSQKRRHPHRRP